MWVGNAEPGPRSDEPPVTHGHGVRLPPTAEPGLSVRHGSDVKAELLGDQNRWFALYTRSRHEKRVAEALEQRGFDTYLPLVPRVSEWHDRKKTVLWPLFPGYVFVRLCPEDAATVLSIPGSVQVIGVAGRPTPIPDEDIDNVKMFVTALILRGHRHPFIQPSTWVRRQRSVRGPLPASRESCWRTVKAKWCSR